MFLYINTNISDSIELALFDDGGCHEVIIPSKRQHEELLLISITNLCTDYGISLQDISGIAVVHGPGSFASLRIALAVANACAYANNIPVIGVSAIDIKDSNNQKSLITTIQATQPGVSAQAVYGSEPNIR